jgi:methionyl-tRNA synthetase
MAHGERYVTPVANVCNEFYDLAGEKFSTSRNHLVRGVDLLAEVPRDLVRCYLALTAPDFQRTNFDQENLRQVMRTRLTEPWNGLAGALRRVVAGADAHPTTDAGRRRCTLLRERFRACYELPEFSLSQAAGTVLDQLARLRASAEAGAVPAGDLLLEVRTWLAGAAPILIDVAGRVAASGVELDLTGELPSVVRTFELPEVSQGAAASLAAAGTPAV